MSKLTHDSVQAFMNAVPFKRANMKVDVLDNVTIMRLHGNPIAMLYNDPDHTLSISNCGWFSKTTKERLNAIPGVSVKQKNFDWYLNDVKWDGNLVVVKL